jgi:hypothetical protein
MLQDADRLREVASAVRVPDEARAPSRDSGFAQWGQLTAEAHCRAAAIVPGASSQAFAAAVTAAIGEKNATFIEDVASVAASLHEQAVIDYSCVPAHHFERAQEARPC